MSVAVQKHSLASFGADALVVSTGTGVLGGLVKITSSSNFSIVPGVNVTGLTSYYGIYEVITNSAITVTLPAAANVTDGWKCRFVLYSSANTGSLNIVSSTSATVASLDSATNVYNFCGCILANSTNALWKTFYGRLRTNGLLCPVYNTSKFLSYKTVNMGRFTAFSGTTAVNVNTGTAVKIPWEVGYPGRYADPAFFVNNPSSNTRIQFTQAGLYVFVRAFVVIDSTGGSAITSSNTSLAFYVDGTPSLFIRQFTTLASATPTGPYVLTYEGTLDSSSYIELGVLKTVTAGTNLTIPASTFVSVQVVGTAN